MESLNPSDLKVFFYLNRANLYYLEYTVRYAERSAFLYLTEAKNLKLILEYSDCKYHYDNVAPKLGNILTTMLIYFSLNSSGSFDLLFLTMIYMS